MSLAVGIIGSGTGSNCRAILERLRDGSLPIEVPVVVADREDAGILEIARGFDVAAVFIPPGNFRTRLDTAAEENMTEVLRRAGVKLVALAGFMRILKGPMLRAFPRRIINIHPSLLPSYPGLEAWKQALAAGAVVTGCTVHYVDDGIDTGEIIAQREVPILAGDSSDSLHRRIQDAEHQLYPQVIANLAAALQRSEGIPKSSLAFDPAPEAPA